MILLELVVVLAAIVLGVRLGGVGIGFAGGLGVLGLAILGVSPGALPLDVIAIIVAVIVAIGAMQVAGGMDYLVGLADRVLRKHPKQLTFLAPLITYLMTLMAGTGLTAFATMPVITEVAKENDIRPSRPLSVAVVASQIAITASPISAAVVFLSAALEPKGVDYLDLLSVAIPSTFLACMATAAIMMTIDRLRGSTSLSSHPEYQRRLAAGTVTAATRRPDRTGSGPGAVRAPVPAGNVLVEAEVLAPAVPAPTIDRVGRRSVVVFALGLVAVLGYAITISEKVGLVETPVMTRDQAIIAIMLSIATVIVATCKVRTRDIATASTFTSGMSASICVLGVAWLGTTFVTENEQRITDAAGDLLTSQPWTLAVVLFFASALLYSQAATTKALIPTALAIGVSPLAAVAAFPAVSALFVLPTYPTLLAAVEMDDTGSTQIGKYVFNHPFLLPGLINITIAVALGFLFGSLLL